MERSAARTDASFDAHGRRETLLVAADSVDADTFRQLAVQARRAALPPVTTVTAHERPDTLTVGNATIALRATAPSQTDFPGERKRNRPIAGRACAEGRQGRVRTAGRQIPPQDHSTDLAPRARPRRGRGRRPGRLHQGLPRAAAISRRIRVLYLALPDCRQHGKELPCHPGPPRSHFYRSRCRRSGNFLRRRPTKGYQHARVDVDEQADRSKRSMLRWRCCRKNCAPPSRSGKSKD